MLALLRAEPAGPRVLGWIAEGDALMSWVNAGEVYYGEVPRLGHGGARQVIDALGPVVRFEEPDASIVMAAARLKADHAMSFADGFAIATAQRHDAPLLTGDPELIGLDEAVEVVDLRVGS